MFLSVYQDILSILFPKYCIGCQEICSSKENFLCPSCRHELRETSFHLQPNNPMKEKFWGRIPIEQAMALLYYQKGGVTQKLIHAKNVLPKYIGRIARVHGLGSRAIYEAF